MTYAKRTTVDADKTRVDIERTLAKYGAKSFAYFTEESRAVVIFEMTDRRIRFDIQVPGGDSAREQQIKRSRWRALLLCIKAKLESVESKIESFEEAFLSHIVMPDGVTVGMHTKAQIAAAYKTGKMISLLPSPKDGGEK